MGQGISAHYDVQIRVVGAQADEALQEVIHGDFLLVEEEFAIGLQGDVEGFAGRVFFMLGCRRQFQIHVLDRGNGGDDEDNQ